MLLLLGGCGWGLLGTSCQPFSAEYTVSLTVAELPHTIVRNITLIDHLILRWFDHQLRYRQRIIPATYLNAGDMRISIAKGVPTPVVLIPVATNGARFSPAGALIAVAERGGHVLQWHSGCAVAVLLQAFPKTVGLHGFNSRRYLQHTTEQPIDRRCWLDGDAIIALLKRGTMRQSAVRSRPLYPANILLPAGTWTPTNTLQPPITSDGAMTKQIMLPYGVFHFFDIEQESYVRLLFTAQTTTIIQSQISGRTLGR